MRQPILLSLHGFTHVRRCRDVAGGDYCLATVTDNSRPALATREAQLLALQVEHIDHVIKSQESTQRDGALQHLARKLRLVQEVVRMFACGA